MSQMLAAIPEQHTKFVQLPNENGHNAVWDFVRSPDDRFYISVCGENEKPLTALLYEYYPKTGELRLIFDVARIWIVDPDQMPPSKIHTSIDFLPDGRLIMATHNTAPAPAHKQWMYEQHYEHPWEGYPGSILMIVDPDTNEVQVKGIPVPRESIYGGMLGNDPRYYYFLGYMKGHFYRLDLETNEVKDYGKVSEFSSCRLVKDAKGRFYGSSYTGAIWRFDPETETVEDLKVHFRSPNGTKIRRQFIFALHSPRGTIFMVDNMDGEMIELHPDTLEVTRHGHIHLRDSVPANPYGIGGLAADDNFVIYYGLKTYDGYSPIRLVRWDILNGGEPENLGIVSPGGKDSQYICEMIFDRDGWLQMVDVCGEFSPYILAVNVKKLEPPGDDAPQAPLRPYTEPDYNGVGAPAFMHIEAETIRTLPLHQHMAWKDTAVRHMSIRSGRLYSIGGTDRVCLTVSDYEENTPLEIKTIYDKGAPAACLDLEDSRLVAMLTSDGRLMTVDQEAASCSVVTEFPRTMELAALHCPLGEDGVLASGRDGSLYVCSLRSGSFRTLENIRLEAGHAAVIKLDDSRLLLSGPHDELLVYDLATAGASRLDVRSASIRGRAFQATVTGGAMLADGTVVAGTKDGMLFTLAPDLGGRTAYGRLYSSGELRGFVKRGGDSVVGIYGGRREACHVFHYSRESGFLDMGRPRVIKDNNRLNGIDTEWACIHDISALAYSPADDMLCVASGELYGCIVRYGGAAFGGYG